MPFRLLVQLSWRNIWRHGRRNMILLSAIAVAVAGVVLLNTLLRGMQAEMRNTIIDSLTGHAKVLQPGYRDDPSIQRGFEVVPGWDAALPAQAIAGWAARVRVPAVIMSERETRGIQLVGIDPAHEHISFLRRVQIEGEGLSGPGDRRLIIGGELAQQLETTVGRRLVLITQGADGSQPRSRLSHRRHLRGRSQRLGEGIRVHRRADAEGHARYAGGHRSLRTPRRRSLRDQHHRQPDGRLHRFWDVLSWKQLQPQAASMVEFADSAIFIYFLVIMGALVFGLVNTLVTAVMERVRELGMLRALGMRPRSVVAQVMMESSLIMFVAWRLAC